jgi:hypothetical protein
MGTRILRMLAVVIGLGIVAVGAPAGAHMGHHCVYRLDPVSRTGRVVEARLVAEGCYGTLAEALSAGTGGSLRIDASVTPATLTQRTLDDATVALSEVVIGIEYTGVGYGGQSASYTAPDTCANTTYEISYVGNAWNDTFVSGKGFGGCDHNKKFQNSNFLGDVLTCTPNCNDYGALRNEVSSLRWKP